MTATLTARELVARWRRVLPPEQVAAASGRRRPPRYTLREWEAERADQRLAIAFDLLLEAAHTEDPAARSTWLAAAVLAVAGGRFATAQQLEAIRSALVDGLDAHASVRLTAVDDEREEAFRLRGRALSAACEKANAQFHAEKAVRS
jgi:hypothetical protein